MVRSQTTNFQDLAPQLFFGGIELTLTALLSFHPGVDFATAALSYLIVIAIFPAGRPLAASSPLAVLSAHLSHLITSSGTSTENDGT